MINSNKKEGQAALLICIKINKKHKGRIIDQETIVVQTYLVCWKALNRCAFVQPHMKIIRNYKLLPLHMHIKHKLSALQALNKN